MTKLEFSFTSHNFGFNMKQVYIHWKDWYWSWNSNTLATWYAELTHLKRPWCWERLRAGGEGDDRGWDSWMASLTQWTWVWVNSGSWRWTGKPGVLQSMGSQRVEHDWATELSWTEACIQKSPPFYYMTLEKFTCVNMSSLFGKWDTYFHGFLWEVNFKKKKKYF